MKLKKILFRSFSRTINIFYIILISVFTIFTGILFYITATNQLSENTVETMQNSVQQKNTFISYVYREIFEQFYGFTQHEVIHTIADDADYSPRDYMTLSEEMEELYGSNSYLIDSIHVNINGVELSFAEQQELRNRTAIHLDDYTHYTNNEGYFWLGNHTKQNTDQERDVQAIAYLATDSSGNQSGAIIMYLNTFFIENILEDNSLENSHMLLMSEEGYYTTEDTEENSDLNSLIHTRFMEDDLSIGLQEMSRPLSQPYYVQHEVIGINNWGMTLVAPKPTLFNSTRTLFAVIVGFALLLTFMAVILLRMVRRYISNPIKEMSQKMLVTQTFDEKLERPEIVPDELGVLYETYNELIGRNSELFNQVTSAQKERMELEVALLHSQVSPHFLYNTLSAIKGLSEMGMNKEASQMTSELSDFFRTSLSRGKEVILIEEELKNVKSYLHIMEKRYGDFFNYTIDVSEDLYDHYIVKLSLQPIIENAIYHGVMKDRKKGMLSLTAKEEEGDLVLSVWDNGKGIKQDKLERLTQELSLPYLSNEEKETGVGLRSVHVRIKNRYGNKYGLTIESDYEKYTNVSIRIPKLKGELNV